MENPFVNYKLEKPKIKSERAELISYFVETILNKNNKQFPAKRIAIALAHIKDLKDLYYFKSVCQDVYNRRGQEAVNKFFWWSIKAR